MMDVSGFVLTGGASSRMGRDKALLRFGSTVLCERIADSLAQVCEKVLLVGHPERYGNLRYECIHDVHPGLGPLSGLEAALDLQLAHFNIFSSCDAFNLSSKWLTDLLDVAKRSGALCTVARDIDGNLQPLCGVYRSECREIVQKAILKRRLRLMDLVRDLSCVTLQLKDTVLNLNTPQEYEEALNASRRQ